MTALACVGGGEGGGGYYFLVILRFDLCDLASPQNAGGGASDTPENRRPGQATSTYGSQRRMDNQLCLNKINRHDHPFAWLHPKKTILSWVGFIGHHSLPPFRVYSRHVARSAGVTLDTELYYCMLHETRGGTAISTRGGTHTIPAHQPQTTKNKWCSININSNSTCVIYLNMIVITLGNIQ